MYSCIGLFGTCGQSKWREPFIAEYKELGVNYFNPQVEHWDPSCAVLEAQHLKSDSIILFPVTGETFGFGSLAESGFSILHCISMNSMRDVVIMVDMKLDDEIVARSPEMAKDSMRARKLVVEHLRRIDLPGVWLVNDLKTMLSLSIDLWKSQIRRTSMRTAIVA